jgi:hypothetical protein
MIFLNFQDAAQMLRQNRRQFEQNVRSSLGGGTINGQQFDVVKKK